MRSIERELKKSAGLSQRSHEEKNKKVEREKERSGVGQEDSRPDLRAHVGNYGKAGSIIAKADPGNLLQIGKGLYKLCKTMHGVS